ncbi:MAG TPA: DNA repair protein RadA, partial [Rhodothermales bacterium]|nr:DNA repair protein RadA [Rhodothermales bacterium]
TRYVCQSCGHESPRWAGQCTGCGEWNTLVEEAAPTAAAVPATARRASAATRGGPRPLALPDVEVEDQPRLKTGLKELDRVLGGGAMRGSLTLVAGDPGVGKSTLMTELARRLPEATVLYVSGEESPQQVKLRARRMGITGERLFLLPETDVEAIAAAAHEIQPDLLIVDSIQTVYRADVQSAPGSVAQVRESAATLLTLTKTLPTTTFLVGHVTKDGAVAGPRVLEHLVDAVLYFEGDRHHTYRILRSVKNRFGAAHELGVFEMKEEGLVEVENPSALFLAERDFGRSGSAVVATMEGTRPLLVEVQALVSPTAYGTPQRTATGFDPRRLQVLLAVLEKREGMRFSTQDVFLNVAGGVRLDEPAVDLAVALAVASSFRDVPCDSGAVAVGEVGLGGEVRGVGRLGPRMAEARHLGFERLVLPRTNMKGLQPPKGLELVPVSRLSEALEAVL